MGERKTPRPRTPKPRKSFSNLLQILEVPNLIEVQTKSFEWFKAEGLKETIQDINPIEDYTGNYAVEFGDYEFHEPALTLKECRDKDQTYAAPLFITVRFVNRESGEIREQNVFMGDFPMMTEQGTFIINGTERVIVTQLVRSPGAYVMAAKDPTKQVLVANLMPARGSWLEFEIDKRATVSVRIDRKRKLPATVFLRALAGIDNEKTKDEKGLLSQGTDEEILALFDDNPFIRATLEKDSVRTVDEALVELFKKQRPGEPPTLEASRNLLWNICFDPKRYDLTKVGRHKLNARLGLDTAHPHQGRHHRSGEGAGGGPAGHRPRAPAGGRARPGRGGSQPAVGRGGQSTGRVRALWQPPPAHGGRTGTGGLPGGSL